MLVWRGFLVDGTELTLNRVGDFPQRTSLWTTLRLIARLGTSALPTTVTGCAMEAPRELSIYP